MRCAFVDDCTFVESKREMGPFAKGSDLHRSIEVLQAGEACLEESLWDLGLRKAWPKTGSGAGSNQDWPQMI